MRRPDQRNELPKPEEAIRVAAALSRLGVLVVLWSGTSNSLMAHSMTAVRVVIGVCSILLLMAGSWIVRVSGMPRVVVAAMWGTAAVTCVGWAWQRVAYVMFIPDGFLTYGYFLTPPGSAARVYMMSGPVELGGLLFATAFGVAARRALKAKTRWWVVTLLLWWLVAFAVFALPSVYLWGQGDAGIFI
jgi:hypothetical protein